MRRLTLSLFGGFEASENQNAITGIESDKVRALLAYLAIESNRPHRRETLCGIFWPEKPERLARRSLSQAIYNLRFSINNHQISPPYLLVNAQEIQFNRRSNHWLDVATFCDQLLLPKDAQHTVHNCDCCLANLQEAEALYSGELLKGFSLNGSPAFEEWALIKREYYNRLYVDLLHNLIKLHQERNECEQAIGYAHKWVDMEPYQEDAYYLLLQMLIHNGQRGEALTQFERCRTLLRNDMDIEPSAKLARLFSHPTTEQNAMGLPSLRLTAGTDTESATSIRTSLSSLAKRPAPLLTRGKELNALHAYLAAVTRGEGKVAFITGEAGRGKSALLKAFCEQAEQQYDGLVILKGACNTHSGIGDSYLPFRDILHLLTSNAESTHDLGEISAKQAARLWDLFPSLVKTLLEEAPDLLESFVPAIPLLRRIASIPGGNKWLTELQALSGHRFSEDHAPFVTQGVLFTQYLTLLSRLAQKHPLLLVLEDLHWADIGTISMLFHIGLRMRDLPIFILGTYRLGEVVTINTQPGTVPTSFREMQPLSSLVDEFKRYFGDIEIPLSRDGDAEFVADYLATIPNRLDRSFQQELDRRTGGNPLFVRELVRSLQDRGQLVQDHTGHWVAKQSIDWGTLPTRIAAVIEEQLNYLPNSLRYLLSVASVEGEGFTAEVLAQVLSTSQQEVISMLSGPLTHYGLVQAQGIQTINQQRLCLYRFRQPMVREHIYNALDAVERPLLHEAVGRTLESVYSVREESSTSIAARHLAHHFQVAGLINKASTYWRLSGGVALGIGCSLYLINALGLLGLGYL